MGEHYDLVVIGAGPAGEKGAAQAAYFGKRVAIVERSPHVGGAGINTGTVPSKTLRETALYYSGLRSRGLYGIDYTLRDDLTVEHLLHREQRVVENEWRIIGHNLERHGIALIRGEASLADPHTVVVREPDGGERRLGAEVILIATGSSPHRPAGVPFDERTVYDSDEILRIDCIPKRMVILGGGVIGCEYACMFAALDAQVTLVEGHDRLLPFVDAELVERMRGQMELLGVRFIFCRRSSEVHPRPDGVTVRLDGGEVLDADVALFAAGRQSNTAGLNLEAVGVELGERGVIQVDENYRTRVPSIYAAGDVIGFPALASTSMEQARIAMDHAFDLGYKKHLARVLPFAVYTIPEMAMAGLTEEACRSQGIPYLVGRAFYENNARGQIIGDLSGMLKLIFAPEDKRILGVHHIGELSAELVHIGTHVLCAEGTLDTFIHSVYNYPTLSEVYKYAAYDGLGRWHAWRRDQAIVAAAHGVREAGIRDPGPGIRDPEPGDG